MKYRLLLIVLFTSFQLLAQYTNKSVGFIENKGQIVNQKGKENKAVLYLLNTNGLNVQLRKNGFSYDIYETKKHKLSKKEKQALYPTTLSSPKKDQFDYSSEYLFHRIDIDFLNSNPKVELIAEEKSTDYDNYYNVAHTKDGITNVHKFKKVTYKNIYDKIDVVFFIPKDSTKAVEYNFIVRPGGKVDDIQLKFNGAKTELVDDKIKMKVRFGQMEETLPLSWVENGNNREEIAVGYRKIDKNIYGFDSNDIVNSEKTIVIDPVPVRLWGTYYGGTKTDYLEKMYSDNLNNLFITGDTSSQNNFATTGSFITTSLVNNIDGYIAKLDSNSNRIWCTYLNSSPSDIKTDSNGNVITTGVTFSDLIGTAGTFQPSRIYLDGFILKLNTNGFRIWGTYYPGRITGCTIGTNDNIFITGYTTTTNNISTIGTHQQTKNGYEDGFLSKFNQNGQRIWGTYYGGNFDDQANDITIDEFNNTYIVGRTESTSDMVFGIPHQINNNNNTIDGFLAKFNDQGNIIFGTFYGGNQNEFFTSIDYKNNKILISGHTSTQTGISTSNAPFPNPINLFANVSNGFFSIFSSNGQLLMGSYFQNTILDNQFDNNGNIFICGDSSDSGIGTSDSYHQNPYNYSVDSYLVKLNPSYTIEWGTYYGGESFETETNIHIDNNNNYIYLGGRTISTNDISSPNSFQPTKNIDWEDAFIVKFLDCQSIFETTSNSPICIGNTIQLNASGGTTYLWTGPNGFSSSLQNPTIPNANASHSGDYSCVISGTGGCDGTSMVTIVVGNTNPPIPTITPLPTITGDCNTTVTIPSAMSACDGMINGTTSNPLTYSLPGTYTIVWNYTDGNGNTATQNQTVTINSQLLPTASTPQIFCIEENATLNDIIITGQSIKWYDALSAGNELANTTLLQNGIAYYASQTTNGCESARVPVMINIQNTPAPTGSDQSFCAAQNPTLNDIVVNGTNVNWYATSTSTSILPSTTILADATTYYATQTVNNCDSTNRIPITITLVNTLNATDFTQEICDDSNNDSEIIDLTSYNTSLISNTANCTFSYYNSLIGAENENATEQINNSANYNLTSGLHNIYVRILSNNGCHQIVALRLTLLPEPIIPINEIIGLCENSNVIINAGAGFDSYLWSTGATTSSITVANAGNYSLTVTNNYSTTNCSSTKNFMVVASNSATISNIITADWTTENNTITIHVSNTSVGDYEYSLDGLAYQDNNIFYGLDSGSYTVYVRDKNGCGTVKDDVYLLMYPKFFTPNNDTHNDTWSIKFSRYEPGLKVALFDRYGKFIKELKFNESWDGTYNSLELPSTDYWFVVSRADGKEHKGHFTLKR